MPLPKPKLPSLTSKVPKTVPMPKHQPLTPAQKDQYNKNLSAVTDLYAKMPTPKTPPRKDPPGGYKSGLSGQQYEGHDLKDYAAMKPKLATKDKVLNPIKKAVGLPGKPAKLVPKKPGQK